MVLTSILIGPVDEEVHGSDLGDLLLFSVQPQDLLTAAFQGLILHGDGRPVVPAESCCITDSQTSQNLSASSDQSGFTQLSANHSQGLI